jgi:hypothetical protein
VKHKHLLSCALVVLGLAYLIQLASPLRLNTDATSFLTLAASSRDGQGFVIDKKPTHFPVGYPSMLAVLDWSGLGCSMGIIGLNLVLLASGCASTAYLLRRSFGFESNVISLICMLTLLSWVLVKHATLPLSDVPFFGVAMACLATLTWSIDQSSSRRLIGLGTGAILIIAAIAVRTVGIALIPALGLSCLPKDWPGRLTVFLKSYPGRSVLLLLVMLGAAAGGCVAVTQTLYFQEMMAQWAGWRELAQIRLEDWGELVINTSLAKLPGSLQAIVPWAGGVGAIVACMGAARRARLDIVDVYAASYAAILLVWPYRDARFWLPILPILAGYTWLAFQRVAAWKMLRRIAVAYVAAFSLMGCIALFYSSRISLAGERFADLYGDGIYRDSYNALSSKRAPGSPKNERGDPKLVRLIERFGSRGYLSRDAQSNSITVR